jgi:hypothetical protein
VRLRGIDRSEVGFGKDIPLKDKLTHDKITSNISNKLGCLVGHVVDINTACDFSTLIVLEVLSVAESYYFHPNLQFGKLLLDFLWLEWFSRNILDKIISTLRDIIAEG